jgi:hypothetical protein
MPGNNYNFGADYIMKQSEQRVDTPDAPLTRMPLEFSTEIKEGDENPLNQPFPKGKSKSAKLDTSILNSDKDKDY